MADTADATDAASTGSAGRVGSVSGAGRLVSGARIAGSAALSGLARLPRLTGNGLARVGTALRETSTVWEKGLSAAIMFVGFIALLFVTLDAINMLFSAASCSTGCDFYQYTLGWVLAMIGPSIAFLPSIGLAISLMVKGRFSFWVPLVGFAFGMLVRWAGSSLMLANVSQTYGF